jgi:MtaA/CmuA family methyltransferase
VGDDRFVGVGSFGPFTTAGQIVGVSEWMMDITDEDYEEEVQALMALAEEVVYQVVLDGIRAGGNLVYIAEPVSSGDLISEEKFEQFSLPALKRLNERMKEDCPYMLLHICGKTMQRVQTLSESGISIFSVDSIDLAEALTLADRKITIMGNLSPVRVLEQQTAEQVEAAGRALCRTAGLIGGFLLAPGCDLTPDTPYENISAMVRAAK